MTKLLSLLAKTPDTILIDSNEANISYQQAITKIEAAMQALSTFNANTIAIFADNQADWVILDFACQIMNVCCIPLPLFFSDKQIQHAIRSADIDLIITDQQQRKQAFEPLVSDTGGQINQLKIYQVKQSHESLKPENTHKITFTSGSTGDPKGVCLSSEQQWQVAQSLADMVVGSVNNKTIRHLCVLPLSTLLENIAGIYAPVLAGGTIILSPMQDLGFNGSAEFQLEKLLHTIEQVQPHSLILLPQLLLALVSAAEAGWKAPESLSFIAVGGGKVAGHLIERAHANQLPVYEGYGLSECSSVVSLNKPDVRQNDSSEKNYSEKNRPGSTGKPLAHLDVQIKDNEIIVCGDVFLGYLNQPESWYQNCVHTGDLGHIDEQGYLYIDGRKKNILVSSYGRNISPEWVESELASHPVIQQCVVIGDAQPCCAALIFPRDLKLPDPAQQDLILKQWIEKVNLNLPDYAQVKTWIILEKALSVADGLLTENGRPRRIQINQTYQTEIQQMYQSMETCG